MEVLLPRKNKAKTKSFMTQPRKSYTIITMISSGYKNWPDQCGKCTRCSLGAIFEAPLLLLKFNFQITGPQVGNVFRHRKVRTCRTQNSDSSARSTGTQTKAILCRGHRVLSGERKSLNLTSSLTTTDIKSVRELGPQHEQGLGQNILMGKRKLRKLQNCFTELFKRPRTKRKIPSSEDF